jgi:hypothetical protein
LSDTTTDDTAIEEHLHIAFHHLKQAVDLSAEKMIEGKKTNNDLGAMWEAFMGQMLDYVKHTGEEKKVNFLNLFSLARFKKRFLR